jgi:DNA ligase-1
VRTQPQDVITKLESDNSRLFKEQVIADAMEEGLDEFFEGLKLALDKLVSFGVKQVPSKDQAGGQGLPWAGFLQLAQSLQRREITGHDARDAIILAMNVATQAQWNDFYRRILIKDMRAGFDVKTVNKVAKKL